MHQIIINTMEHVPNMQVLLVGRVLGGLSTSLLFSAFESWMVTEHRRSGFPERWLAGTFGWASSGNGVVAIGAGFFAQIAADARGDIGPFQLAIVLTILCLLLILFWEENYGHNDKQNDARADQDDDASQSAERQSLMQILFARKDIVCLGLSQAFFEGAVYTFGE